MFARVFEVFDSCAGTGKSGKMEEKPPQIELVVVEKIKNIVRTVSMSKKKLSFSIISECSKRGKRKAPITTIFSFNADHGLHGWKIMVFRFRKR